MAARRRDSFLRWAWSSSLSARLFDCGRPILRGPRPTSYKFSGPREMTQWAILESALKDIALATMILGSGLISVAVHHHLRARSSANGPSFTERNSRRTGKGHAPRRRLIE